MPGTVRIGSIAGIDIDIHASWLIILALLTVSLATGWLPEASPGQSTTAYWVVGFIASLLLFVSVLLHELAHSLVARQRGLPVHTITLFIFGGVSNIEQEPKNPGVEFQMAVVGPLTSLIIGVAGFLIVGLFLGTGTLLAGVLFYLGFTNIVLAIFNLLPGFPLDGGRVLRSIVWKITGNMRKATRVAAITGQILAYLFIFLGIWVFFSESLLDGIWLGFTGWFLLNAAQAAHAQASLESVLRGAPVSSVMNPSPTTVPANISLRQVVDSYFLPTALRAAPVVQVEQLVGLITLGDIWRIPREQWEHVPVSQVMVPLNRLHVVSPQQLVSDLLPLIAGHDVNQVPVVDSGRLVGIVTRDAIVQYLHRRQSPDADRPIDAVQGHLRPAA
jgi:Zn-dependent protease/CBS domain-containing protein